jgi:ATP-dependent DNA ligase
MQITEKTAMLAKAPTGRENLSGWLLEPKYDGWRGFAVIGENGSVRWFGRSGLEYSGHTPLIDEALQNLPPGTVLDGELIHPDGWRHAQEILGSEDRQSEILEYVIFDILWLGKDLRGYSLIERRGCLENLTRVNVSLGGVVKLAPQSEYTEEAVKALVVEGWEGGVAKNPNSSYVGGRRSTWLKFKAEWTEDAVVYGGVAAKGELEGLVGSLKIGQYNEEGELVPLGNAWGKFTREERVEITKLWKSGYLDSKEMVVELTIQGFTNKGKFRAPVIQRIRKDKLPSECTYTDKSEIYTL